MAKFNIEVNLEWLGEDGDLDSVLKQEIINSVVDRISEKAVKGIEQKVNNLVDDKVNDAVGLKLNEVLEDFLSEPRTITDRWGDVKETDITVIDLLKKACDDFMEGNVDENGKPNNSSYGKTKKRIDYIVDKNINYTMEASINKAASEIKKKLEAYIDTTLKAQIGENVAKIIGLDSIIKKS